MVSLSTYDPENAMETGLIEPGDYVAFISASAERLSRAGDPYIQLEFTLEESGRRLWENLHLNHSTSDVARKIANGRITAIIRALQLSHPPSETEELHDLPMIIRVKTKEGKDRDGNSREESAIIAFKPISDAAPEKPAPVAKKVAPKRAAPTPKASDDGGVPW